METNVIDARHAFCLRTLESQSTKEQLEAASRVIANAVDQCERLNVAPDAVTTALTIQMLKLADSYDWSEEKRKILFSPALLRLVGRGSDVPY